MGTIPVMYPRPTATINGYNTLYANTIKQIWDDNSNDESNVTHNETFQEIEHYEWFYNVHSLQPRWCKVSDIKREQEEYEKREKQIRDRLIKSANICETIIVPVQTNKQSMDLAAILAYPIWAVIYLVTLGRYGKL